jgi:hypothetical protein
MEVINLELQEYLRRVNSDPGSSSALHQNDEPGHQDGESGAGQGAEGTQSNLNDDQLGVDYGQLDYANYAPALNPVYPPDPNLFGSHGDAVYPAGPNLVYPSSRNAFESHGDAVYPPDQNPFSQSGGQGNQGFSSARGGRSLSRTTHFRTHDYQPGDSSTS